MRGTGRQQHQEGASANDAEYVGNQRHDIKSLGQRIASRSRRNRPTNPFTFAGNGALNVPMLGHQRALLMANPFATYIGKLDSTYRDQPYFSAQKARLLAAFSVGLLVFVPLNVAKLLAYQ